MYTGAGKRVRPGWAVVLENIYHPRANNRFAPSPLFLIDSGYGFLNSVFKIPVPPCPGVVANEA